MKRTIPLLLTATLGLSTLSALAAPKSDKPGMAKGQEQMKGGEGAFGAIYTMRMISTCS